MSRHPFEPHAPTPISSMTRLSVVDPDGTVRELGRIYRHRHPLLTFLIDTPLRWARDRNIRRHNARMERLAAAKRAIQ